MSLGVFLFLLSNTSHSLITIVSEKRMSSRPIEVEVRGGDKAVQSSRSGVVGKSKVKSSGGKSCPDLNYIPLKLLSVISEAEGDPIVIEDNIKTSDSQKKIKITHRPHLKTCTKFKYELVQSEGVNTSAVSVLNEFDFDEFLKDQEITISGKVMSFNSSQLQKMTVNDKYEACLILKGVLKENKEGKFELKWPESDLEYSQSVETFEVSFDGQKTMKVLYGSPGFLGTKYGSQHRWVSGSGLGIDCFKLEDLSEPGVNLYSEADIETSKYLDICERGDHVQIREALKSVGNAPDLRKVLEGALSRELEKMLEDHYTQLQDLGSQIIKAKDEESVASLVKDYSQKLSEVKKYIIAPSIAKLEDLYKKRASEINVDKRESLDQEILELNNIIGTFAKMEGKFKTGKVLDKLLVFGMRGEAEEIAEFQLKSKNYGRVYLESGRGVAKGRDPKIAPEKASKNVERGMFVFSARAKESEKAFNAKQGNATYSQDVGATIRRVTAMRENQFQNDMHKINKNMESCQAMPPLGFMKNPSRCQYAMRNKDHWFKEAYQRRGSYNRMIKSQTDRYERFNAWEQEGQRKRVQESGAMDEGGMFFGAGNDSLGTYGMDYMSSFNNSSYSTDPESMFSMAGPGGVPGMPGPYGQQMYNQNPFAGGFSGGMNGMNGMMPNAYGQPPMFGPGQQNPFGGQWGQGGGFQQPIPGYGFSNGYGFR